MNVVRFLKRHSIINLMLILALLVGTVVFALLFIFERQDRKQAVTTLRGVIDLLYKHQVVVTDDTQELPQGTYRIDTSYRYFSEGPSYRSERYRRPYIEIQFYKDGDSFRIDQRGITPSQIRGKAFHPDFGSGKKSFLTDFLDPDVGDMVEKW